MEGMQHPMELDLPVGAQNLEVVREIQPHNGHEQLGHKLLIYGNIEPGNSTIAFRYHLSVWLGSVDLSKVYPHPVKTLSVLTPKGTMYLVGKRFEAKPTQTIDGTPFSAWSTTDIAAGQPVDVRMGGVPIRQEVYLIPTGGFVVVMLGVVLWFVRKRLRAGQGEASA